MQTRWSRRSAMTGRDGQQAPQAGVCTRRRVSNVICAAASGFRFQWSGYSFSFFPLPLSTLMPAINRKNRSFFSLNQKPVNSKQQYLRAVRPGQDERQTGARTTMAVAEGAVAFLAFAAASWSAVVWKRREQKQTNIQTNKQKAKKTRSNSTGDGTCREGKPNRISNKQIGNHGKSKTRKQDRMTKIEYRLQNKKRAEIPEASSSLYLLSSSFFLLPSSISSPPLCPDWVTQSG